MECSNYVIALRLRIHESKCKFYIAPKVRKKRGQKTVNKCDKFIKL